jgi:histidinol-phosphate/aromatic aminotransferase/cobyric acid decarboxylase-like protein
VRFPLADWIDDHPDVPHNLGQSGLKGTLSTLEKALRRPESPDPETLIEELARQVGVAPRRLFLTHGASEGNALVLVFLARALARPSSRWVRYAIEAPEYPPLSDGAAWAGFQPATAEGAVDLALGSDPNNPTGTPAADRPGFAAVTDRARAVLVDETFREFTDARSRAAGSDPRVWTTGTFTKVYGADRIRVGFVVAPAAAVDVFARFHGVMTDEIAPASVAAARAILRDRARILGEARERLRCNLSALRRRVDGVPALRAPVHFDRGPQGLDGDAFGAFALRAGVLVCPGSYFGDPTGVRLCLTAPTFPDDLAAYLEVRERWLERDRVRPSPGRRRRASRRSLGGPSAADSSE